MAFLAFFRPQKKVILYNSFSRGKTKMLNNPLNLQQNSDHVGSGGTFCVSVNPWVIDFYNNWDLFQMEPGGLNHGQKKDRIGDCAPPKFVEKFPLTSGNLVFLHDN